MKIATLMLACLAPLFFISCKSQEKRKMEEAVTGVVNTKIRPVIQNNLNNLVEPLKKQAVPLSEAEKKAFKGYFKDSLLNSVRVVRVTKLPNLTFSDSFIQALAEHDINVGRLAIGKIQGMTFDKTIIIRKGSDELNTIFHELVHVVQYQILGVEGFLQRYYEKLLSRSYEDIPLEKLAYYLEERFTKSKRWQYFSVEKYLMKHM